MRRTLDANHSSGSGVPSELGGACFFTFPFWEMLNIYGPSVRPDELRMNSSIVPACSCQACGAG